jgi:hypothetical protein
MEDAPPIAIEQNINNINNINNNEMKFDKSEIFPVGNIYNFKISYNEKIFLFEIEEINQIPKKEWKILLNLEELGKINRYFLQFESTKDVFEALKVLIQKKNVSLVKEPQNLMRIMIKNPSNEKVFYIDIPYKENILKNEQDSVMTYIKSLTNRITNLENRVSYLENQFIQFKAFNQFKESQEFANCKPEIKYNEAELALIGDFSKSNIIGFTEAIDIIGWLDAKPKCINLLLNSKYDGDKTKTFYERCQGKAPTLVIIKTTDQYRFGGYITIPWKNKKYGICSDGKSFIFSLDRRQKYQIVKANNAIQTDFYYFAFGAVWPEIYIENDCHTNLRNSTSKYGNYNLKEDLNGGKRNYKVLSYEVYEIIY